MLATTEKVWSDQQKDIFEWFRTRKVRGGFSKHLIVRARAGTGKTTTILRAVGESPDNDILLSAFNKKIADELNTRLSSQSISQRKAVAKTLHSLGCGLVYRNWGAEIAPKDNPPISRADHLTNQVCGPTVPDTIKNLISRLHTMGREMMPHAKKVGELTDIALQFDLEPDYEWLADGYDLEYVEKKALEAMELAATVKPVETGIDFADMIFLPIRNRWLQKRYKGVVIDEAQDMTMAQLELAIGVCKDWVCVVGDDRQAIYAFRGADSNSLDRLKKELNAAELGLTGTYRCGQTIVAEAQRLVPDFECWATHDGSITDLGLSKLTGKAEYGDFILSRLNAPLTSVAMSLLRNNKRVKIAGKDIGKGLTSLIKKLTRRRGTDNLVSFLERLADWREREVARWTAAKKPHKVDQVNDKAEMLIDLSDGVESLEVLVTRIEGLFTDYGLGAAGVITCSTVHKAKGLEANRVFILRDTLYPRGKFNIEEQNIEYVAITRAKEQLVWVSEYYEIQEDNLNAEKE